MKERECSNVNHPQNCIENPIKLKYVNYIKFAHMGYFTLGNMPKEINIKKSKYDDDSNIVYKKENGKY